jgi:ribosomal protein S18 acetylase RimI-like enzyme
MNTALDEITILRRKMCNVKLCSDPAVGEGGGDAGRQAPSSSPAVHFRQAAGHDLEAVAGLLGHLGYPLDPADLKEMFVRLLEDAQTKILLAVSGSEVVGLVTVRTHPVLRFNGFQATIEELVVHPDYRAQGIGKGLLYAVNLLALMQGTVRVEVQTSTKRESFRGGFYEKNGFERAQSALYLRDLPGCDGDPF